MRESNAESLESTVYGEALTGLLVALAVYTVISLRVGRPSPTPLDFLAATAPSYGLLQVAVAVLVLSLLGSRVPFEPLAAAWGYGAGLAFVAAPQLVGIARRECLHQLEIRGLYPARSLVLRDLAFCCVTVPAIATCEEVVLRGIVRLPEPIVVVGQFLLCLAAAPGRALGSAVACAFLGLLHHETRSLSLVIGAHAAIQTLTGRLGIPGLFGAVYPLLEQAGWRNLAAPWQPAVLEMATAALLLRLGP
jgi:membrane protease YdiL (CAAX protease family)